MEKKEFKNIIYQVTEGIALITMNRPQAMNALNSELFDEFAIILDRIEQDTAVQVVIITGAGKAFIAGADISQMQRYSTLEGRDFCVLGQRLINRLEELDKPVIAAINGFALGGGCELAMACDLRIASERAKFGQPEVNLGIIPGYGGTQRLARFIGKGKAKYYIYTGELIGAAEAYQLGLVEKVVPPEELMSVALKIANTIQTKAPVAIKMAKRAINKGLEMDLASGIAFEAEAYTTTFSSEDRLEGMTAFLEKREPHFKGC
ncbi:MAG: enoyl-CoA hydratase-related protein [Peptococcia bacterium]